MLDGIFGVQHVEYNGEPVSTRRTINFTGAVEVTDDPENDRTNIAVSNPTGGQAYGLLYEVDFTALDSQTMASAGSYTIDGMTWWQKAGSESGRNSVALTNGSGLGLTWVGGACAWAATGNIEYRIMMMPLAQITGFNASAPTVAQFRFGGGTYGGTNWVLAGFIEAAASSAAWSSADRNRQQLVGVGFNGTSVMVVGHGTTGPAQRSITGTWSSPPTDHAFGVIQATKRAAFSGHGAYSSGFPDPWGLTSGLGELVALADFSNPCVAFMFNCQSAFTAYLTHMRIMQPKVG